MHACPITHTHTVGKIEGLNKEKEIIVIFVLSLALLSSNYLFTFSMHTATPNTNNVKKN